MTNNERAKLYASIAVVGGIMAAALAWVIFKNAAVAVIAFFGGWLFTFGMMGVGCSGSGGHD